MFNEITLLLFCIEIYRPWLNIDLACGSLQSPVAIFQGQIKYSFAFINGAMVTATERNELEKEKRGSDGI